MSKRHIIVGAGISGLALGWSLKKRLGNSDTLMIIEGSDRTGGWIRSRSEKGFLFEEGPRSCRSRGNGVATLQLIEELGLCNEVINAESEAKKRYIYWQGKLREIPANFFSFLFSPLIKDILPALWKEWSIPPGDVEDESVNDFFVRRFGLTIAEKFIDPLVSGIYAGDMHKISMRSCFPDFYRMEQTHGSLFKAMFKGKKANKDGLSAFVNKHLQTSIFSFKNGMETLIKALNTRLMDNIHLSCAAKSLQISNGELEVVLDSGQRLLTDHLYLAVPAPAASLLLNEIDPVLAMDIAKNTYTSVAVVNMGWNENVLKYPGFGYLVPSSQKEDILGVVFDSSALAAQNNHSKETRLSVMLGGAHHPEITSLSHQKIISKATKAIQRHLGIVQKPRAVHLAVSKNAIPQYEIGHEARLHKIKSKLKQISHDRIQLLGSAWNGVAVNDCIAESRSFA